jgi:hypothetical protein
MSTPWTRRVPQIVERRSTTLPQTGDAALFRIRGGKIRVLNIVGEVTVAIQNQANNTKLKFNPAGAGSDTDLCTATSIANDQVGELYTISGDFSDALKTSSAFAAETDANMEAPGVILGPGDIELDCAASNSGQVKWTLVYEVIDSAANVVAVY